jgi:nucleotide-binding universal stress UspA family protein
MKKIVAVFDGSKFSDSTLQYAIRMGLQHNATITGVFSEKMEFAYAGGGGRSNMDGSMQFERACQHAGIHYNVRRGSDAVTQSILKESRYADMLLIDASETMNPFREESPTPFVKDILANAKCPVLLLPRHFTDVRKICWLYDGSPVSIFAFKMFSYILPVFNALPLNVVTVQTPNHTQELPYEGMVKELIDMHAPQAHFVSLKGQPEVEIAHYLREQALESLVILGAYQRNALSMLFRPSMADILVREHQWPLFIAHNK